MNDEEITLAASTAQGPGDSAAPPDQPPVLDEQLQAPPDQPPVLDEQLEVPPDVEDTAAPEVEVAPEERVRPQRRPRRSRDGLFTIGQVVEQLGPEFPDLSISKIRYLEDRGLVTPTRTAGGYRKFSANEIRRLRTILTLQRDEFLPLEVIRERLSRGTASTVATPLAPSALLETHAALRRNEKSYPVSEALELAGVDEDLFRQLGEYHLIERGPAGVLEAPPLSETDVEITRVCGLLARHGVEPRNLRLLRSAIERESSMMEQLVAPALRSAHPERREEGEQILRDVGSLLSRLLDLLLYKELRRLVE